MFTSMACCWLITGLCSSSYPTSSSYRHQKKDIYRKVTAYIFWTWRNEEEEDEGKNGEVEDDDDDNNADNDDDASILVLFFYLELFNLFSSVSLALAKLHMWVCVMCIYIYFCRKISRKWKVKAI